MTESILREVKTYLMVEYTLWDGSKSYLCGDCYQRSLTAATPQVPMWRIGGFTPPQGATCAGCKGAVVGRTDTIYDIVPSLDFSDDNIVPSPKGPKP